MCGMGRAGKTQLIRALLDHGFDENCGSTIGAEEEIVKFVHAKLGKSAWSQHSAPEKELEEALAQLVVQEQSQKKTKEAASASVSSAPAPALGSVPASAPKSFPDKIRGETSKFSPESAASSGVSGVGVDATTSQSNTNAPVNVDNKLVKKLLEQKKDEATGDASPVVVSFLDLGGQEVFYPLHSFFISPDGLYLIVFNMEDLLPTARPEVKAEALDYIHRWINAIVVDSTAASVFTV